MTPSGPGSVSLADGGCATLLDLADVGSALGRTAAVDTPPGGQLPQLGIVGGIRCRWVSGAAGAPGSGDAVLDVVPVAIAEPGEIEGAAATFCGQGDPGGCLVDGHTNGWWYELRVTTMTGPDEQSAASRALDGLVQIALSRHTPSERIEALPAVDCAAAELGGLPATSSQAFLSADQGAPALAADRLARPTLCGIVVAGQRWTVVVYPRTVAPFSYCARAPGAERLDLPGVDAVQPGTGGMPSLCARDGTSSLTLAAPGAPPGSPWTDALLATAGRLVPPLLALASAA